MTSDPLSAVDTSKERELDRSLLQGIGLAGFRKDHQHLMFVDFGTGDAGKHLIRRLAPLVANDTEVSRFNALFSEIRRRRGTAQLAERAVQATWIGFGVTGKGWTRSIEARMPARRAKPLTSIVTARPKSSFSSSWAWAR